MDVIDAIKHRRSVRKYQDRKVSDDILMDLIDAARLAPSGNNAQPWMYKIITSSENIALLRSNDIFKQDFVYTAPALILCCGNPDKYPKSEFKEAIDDSNDMRAIRDLGISSQNLVLRATELGLGTCYVGWMDKPRVKKIFNIPDNYIVPYVITVGYPEGSTTEVKKKNIDEIIL